MRHTSSFLLRLLPLALCLVSCSGTRAVSDSAFLHTEESGASISESTGHTLAELTQKAHSGVTLSNDAIVRGNRNYSVPILMYHYIRPMPGPKDKLGIDLTVTPETFSHQLDILQTKGYHTISFADLANTGSALPLKPIILTFDDGYQDAFDHAFPALMAHHMTATFYIITGFVGKPNYATWDELQKMSGSGMEMGAHTVHHLDLRKLPPAKQTQEIADSIQTIEDTLHVPVQSLAYPAGRYIAETMKITKKTGLPFAVTTHLGVAKNTMNQMQLPRVRINDKTNFEKVF